MKRYTKKDITFHDDGFFGRTGYAAINVKVYQWLHPWERMTLQEELNLDEETFQQAASDIWDMFQQEFWMVHIPDLAKEYNVEDLDITQSGRAGGWVRAEKADVETVKGWKAPEVARWGRFEQAVKDRVSFFTSFQTAKQAFQEWKEIQENVHG